VCPVARREESVGSFERCWRTPEAFWYVYVIDDLI